MGTSVLVIGATGTQGGAVAEVLLANGHRVLAGTRDPGSERAELLRAKGAEPVRVDLTVPGSIGAAAEGVDAVYLVTVPDTGADHERAMGVNAVAELAAAGVGHVVHSSVASANRGTGIPHFEGKYRIEQALEASGVPYTIIAPVFFMDNPRPSMARSGGRVLAAPIAESTVLQQIAVADIAKFAGLVLADPARFAGQRIEIAGDRLTGHEQAAAFSEALGFPVRYQPIPADPAMFGPDLTAMFTWFDAGGYSVDIEALHAAYPEIGWLGFRDWAKKSASVVVEAAS
ncbi:NmrA/HSCARG family protein [Amycolatopsis sp. NPDC059657]|uniref:NmrA/HSCARG family protein n=1 Tax=Amycolatopsis sp. NPDC059657 TaxID=3346899 RepID=UPI003671EC79